MDKGSIPAWIALGLSTLTFVWTIFWSIKTKRIADARHVELHAPALTVTVSFGLPVSGPHVGPQCLVVRAVNTGHVPLTAAAAAIYVKGDPHNRNILPKPWLTPGLPKKLSPGEHWDAPFVELADLQSALKEMRLPSPSVLIVTLTDPAGRPFRGETTPIPHD